MQNAPVLWNNSWNQDSCQKQHQKLHKTLEWNMTKSRLNITPHNTKPEEERMCSRLINQHDWSHINLTKVSLLFALSQFIKQMVIMISWIFKKWALQLPIPNFPLKFRAIFQDTATKNSQNRLFQRWKCLLNIYRMQILVRLILLVSYRQWNTRQLMT